MVTLSCKKPFEPIAITTDYSYLVVDGAINTAANASTTIILSRTKRLTDTTVNVPELNAQVTIEAENGGSFLLQKNGNGVYNINQPGLNNNIKYRLRIKTSDGKEFLSEFVAAKVTPAIDSISWQQPDDISISLYTHDPLNNTRYYRWEFVETWEYNAISRTPWIEKNGRIQVKTPAEERYTCWASTGSTNILIGSTIKLTDDIVSNQPITIVLLGSVKGLIKYSILVKQYALAREAYDYWQILKKNTQNLGTFFDPQPSQLKGNIKCLSNPSEPVIGFISACSIQEKRIFISAAQLNNWPPLIQSIACQEQEIPKNPLDDFLYTYPDTTFAPYFFVTGGGLIIAKKDCLDCTRNGGLSIKPIFWQ
jgi:hypothetical protein